MERCIGQMVLSIRENGIKVSKMAMEFWFFLMAPLKKVFLRITSTKAKVNLRKQKKKHLFKKI